MKEEKYRGPDGRRFVHIRHLACFFFLRLVLWNARVFIFIQLQMWIVKCHNIFFLFFSFCLWPIPRYLVYDTSISYFNSCSLQAFHSASLFFFCFLSLFASHLPFFEDTVCYQQHQILYSLCFCVSFASNNIHDIIRAMYDQQSYRMCTYR